VEIFGPSQCGKTYLALSACSTASSSLWIDLDGTFPYVYAKPYNIEDKLIIISQSDKACLHVSSFLETYKPDIIVADPTHSISTKDRYSLYRTILYYSSKYNIPSILVSSGVDNTRMTMITSVRIEMALVRKTGDDMIVYTARTIKNINHPAWQNVSFSREIQ